MGSILVSLLTSALGFIYFTYGKKLSLASFMLAGIALLAYPYFVDGLTTKLILGGLLAIWPLALRR